MGQSAKMADRAFDIVRREKRSVIAHAGLMGPTAPSEVGTFLRKTCDMRKELVLTRCISCPIVFAD